MKLIATTVVAMALWSMCDETCVAGEEPSSEEPARTEQADEFDGLLSMLGSPSFIQRDWAARRILQQGPDAVPQLVAVVRDLKEPETAAAAIRLLVSSSQHADPLLATKSLLGLASLHGEADQFPVATRQLLAAGYEEASRHHLFRLAALGAEFDHRNPKSILQISIHSARFRDEHMPLLAPYRTLEQLDLRDTPITGEGLPHLSSLENLQHLNLTDTRVTGADLRRLPPLPRLERLSLFRVTLSEDDLSWLRKNYPRCQVRH